MDARALMMDARELLTRKPWVTGGVCFVALGLSWLAFQQLPTRGTVAKHSYFTDDDGNSWFIGDASIIPPFAHNGKEAVRAHLYTCDGGKTLHVAYLEKFVDPASLPPSTGSALGGGGPPMPGVPAGSAPGGPPPAGSLPKAPGGAMLPPDLGPRGCMVKRAGDSQWSTWQDWIVARKTFIPKTNPDGTGGTPVEWNPD